MQSALVRKDAVMLHDPMRTHSRATLVGVVLAALGMLGFVVFGLISPKGGALEGESIVMSKESGSVYVATGNPIKLIPTFNVASARLLMAAQLEKQGKQPSEEGQAPKLVDDDALAGVQKGPLTGIPGAPHLLPDAEEQISENWAVCDKIEINQQLENPNTGNVSTTVLGGLTNLGTQLGDKEALLAQANEKVYLVYRAPKDPRTGQANVVRAELNMNDLAMKQAFGVNDAQMRKMSTGMLNAIPEASPLVAPDIANAGQSSEHLPDLQIGDVFSTNEIGGGRKYYVLLQDGKQQISVAAAKLIAAGYTQGGDPPVKESAAVAQVPNTTNPLNLGSYPTEIPEVLMAEARPTACLGWSAQGEGETRQAVTNVFVGSGLPKDEEGNNLNPVKVSQPNADGTRINGFYMPRNKGAVVRGATSGASFGSGPIYLISDNGVKYSVPDVNTAKILGLEPQKPAPDSIIRLLPNGASLSTQEALRTFDGANMTAGGGNASGSDGGPQSGG